VTRARRCLLGLLLAAVAACGDGPEDLVSRLHTRDPAELRELRGKLVRMPNPLAVPALRGGLQSEKWRTRYMSAQLLGLFRDSTAVDDLLVALGDSVGGVRAQAATALGRLQARRAEARLLTALEDDTVVQVAAVGALQELGTPAALPALLERAHHGESLELRAAAVSALGACAAGTAREAEILDVLRQMLAHPLVRLRQAALVGFSGLDYRGTLGDVCRALHDESPEVQHVAVQALAQVADAGHPARKAPDAPSVDVLIAALDSLAGATNHSVIRARARQALDRFEAHSAPRR
jgi:HEAT repeat protein